MTLILTILACVFLFLAAFKVGTARVDFGWMGLAIIFSLPLLSRVLT